METGDFENTPVPSARPSLAVLRPDEVRPDEDDTSNSIPSSQGGSMAYRHHLLKTSATGPLVIDRDLPVPPVVSRNSPPKTQYAHTQPAKGEQENYAVLPIPKTPPPAHLTNKYEVALRVPASEKVIFGPKSVRDAHDPEIEALQTLYSPGRDSPVSDRASIRSGETYQVMPDGTLYAVKVRVPVPRTQGHSPIVKVRSASNHSTIGGSVDEDRYVAGRPQPVQKAAPFDPEGGGPTHKSNSRPRNLHAGNQPKVQDNAREPHSQSSRAYEQPETEEIFLHPVWNFDRRTESANTIEHHQSSRGSKVRLFEADPRTMKISHDHKELVRVHMKDKPLSSEVELSIPTTKLRPSNAQGFATYVHEHTASTNKVKPFQEPEDEPDDPLRQNAATNEIIQPALRAQGNEAQGLESSMIDWLSGTAGLHDISGCDNFPAYTQIKQHEWTICPGDPLGNIDANGQPSSNCRECLEPPPLRAMGEHNLHDCSGIEYELEDMKPDSRDSQKELRKSNLGDRWSKHDHILAQGAQYQNSLHWIKQAFQQTENKSTVLTGSAKSEDNRRRTSEPTAQELNLSPGLTRSLTHSTSDHTIDCTVLQRAIEDLERLFNEAMAIMSQSAEEENSPGNQSANTKGVPYKSELKEQPLSPRPYISHVIESFPNKTDDLTERSSQNKESQDGNDSGGLPQISLIIPTRQSSRAVPASPCPYQNYTKKGNGTNYTSMPSGYLCGGIESVDFDQNKRQGITKRDKHFKSRAARQQSSSPYPLAGDDVLPERDVAGRQMRHEHAINLRNRSHVSLRGLQPFSLARSHKGQSIARDWSPFRKRFVATVACLSTALIGLILGIYSGLVPKIQYYILDESYTTVHGNTGCFIGLAIPTFFFWPLPLLHGRKPYILGSLSLAMPLLFPQALAVNSQRMTNTGSWRAMLLISRTLMGVALGFASMNFHSILTDLFGASLMSANPHEEVVDQFDARRHGGGMGIWLGIWTWCWIGSLSLGFLIGAAIIDEQPPAWGFYISIMSIAVVLVLNIMAPEVRRSAYRRSMTEVRTGTDISRRIARGEVMMHRVKTGPKWCGQEVLHGVYLSLEMLRQPGFAVLALYVAWIYAQVVLIIILLGSLTSRMYKLTSPHVGLHVACLTLGAFLAIPFQKASYFSRSRAYRVNTSKATLDRKLSWTSHLLRRAVFSTLLPVAGGFYAAASGSPPLHISLPSIVAVVVGFLSSLAISECNGIVMETFDTSDLCPGMTGRQRDPTGKTQKRTNYSSFPRVTAGYAIIHSLSFVLSAGSTALGGQITRTLGQQVTTGIVAGILFFLTVSLLLVLVRFKNVPIIPDTKTAEMDKIVDARRKSIAKIATVPEDEQVAEIENDEAWRPFMIGNPVSQLRRMNVLEFGSMTRWQEIRKRNKLIDEDAHLCNRTALGEGLDALDDHMSELRRDAQGLLHMASLKGKRSRRFRRSDQGSENSHQLEMDNLSSAGESVEQGRGPPFVERDYFIGQTVMEEGECQGEQSRKKR